MMNRMLLSESELTARIEAVRKFLREHKIADDENNHEFIAEYEDDINVMIDRGDVTTISEVSAFGGPIAIALTPLANSLESLGLTDWVKVVGYHEPIMVWADHAWLPDRQRAA